MTYKYSNFQRITVDPEVCFGKPVIKGTRMPIASILSYLSGGMTMEDFFKEFDWLTREDVLEAMAFAAGMVEHRIIPLKN